LATLLLLAAGMGSRYGGTKQLAAFGPNGETLLDYAIRDAIAAGFDRVVFISRKDILADTQAIFCPKWGDKVQIDFVLQTLNPAFPFETSKRVKPWGVTQALLSAQDAINTPFALINADDFYGAEAFQKAFYFLASDCNPQHAAMIGYSLYATLSDYGGVSRGICEIDKAGFLQKIREESNIFNSENGAYIEANGKQIQLEDSFVSMNFWCFHPSIFGLLSPIFEDFAQKNAHNVKAELPLPPAIDNLIQQTLLQVKVIPNPEGQWMGVTYPEDKTIVMKKINRLLA
jgi:MobA-like NTP transferase domain